MPRPPAQHSVSYSVVELLESVSMASADANAHTIKFVFVFSTQDDNLPLGPVTQKHGQITVITVGSVPPTEVQGASVSDNLLSFAEAQFMIWVDANVEGYLIRWKCHLQAGDGQTLSEFANRAPA